MISMRNDLRLGTDGNIEQLSKNDKGIPELLDEGTKKNGNHYEVPLPFKQKGIKIPTNKFPKYPKYKDLRRMHQLTRRFKKRARFLRTTNACSKWNFKKGNFTLN